MTRQDARDRVVDAAVARLHQRGVSVALDGISLEEAITDSGVSRATAYRRWPNRTEFLREVLVRTVRAVRLEPETREDLEAIRAVVRDQADHLDTEAGRRTVVIESLRIATQADHRRLATSRQWRDYLALRVTCEGLPDAELRQSLTQELAAAESAFVRHRAEVYSRIPEVLGYRLTTPVPGDEGFVLMAEVMGALMTGLILHQSTAAQPATFTARAFGSQVAAQWTTASYALTAMFLTYLQPDPEAGQQFRIEELLGGEPGE